MSSLNVFNFVLPPTTAIFSFGNATVGANPGNRGVSVAELKCLIQFLDVHFLEKSRKIPKKKKLWLDYLKFCVEKFIKLSLQRGKDTCLKNIFDSSKDFCMS